MVNENRNPNKVPSTANLNSSPTLPFAVKHQFGSTLLIGAIILFSGFAMGIGCGIIYFTQIRPANINSATAAGDNRNKSNDNAGNFKNNSAGKISRRVNSLIKRLDRQYKLTSEQKIKAKEILTERLTEIDTIIIQNRQEMATQYAQLKADFKKILTAKQYKCWASHFNRLLKARHFRRPDFKHSRKLHEAIRKADTNKDKQIDQNEFESIKSAKIMRMLKRADKNGDHIISTEEIKIFLRPKHHKFNRPGKNRRNKGEYNFRPHRDKKRKPNRLGRKHHFRDQNF